MTFDKLAVGDTLRLGPLPYVVEAVSESGAVLVSAGRWSVLRVDPDGRLFDVTGAQVGRRGPGRALHRTLDDVVPAS